MGQHLFNPSNGTSIDGWWNDLDESCEFEEVWFWDTTEIYDYDGDLVVVGLLYAAFSCLEEVFHFLNYPNELMDKVIEDKE